MKIKKHNLITKGFPAINPRRKARTFGEKYGHPGPYFVTEKIGHHFFKWKCPKCSVIIVLDERNPFKANLYWIGNYPQCKN